MDCELCQSRKSIAENKNQQKDSRNKPNEHFCRVLEGKFGKGSLYFLPKSTRLIHFGEEMRSSEGWIDHPSLSRFPLAGASGYPKMLPIWMILRVGETDLRDLDIDFEGLVPRIGPFWGKGSLHFLHLARN